MTTAEIPHATTSVAGARAQIGGIVGPPADVGDAERRLAHALGRDRRLLGEEGAELVAEWDACFLGTSPIADTADWERIVHRRRLGEVEGAYALAWRDADGTLHLARDGVGERSLYYARVGGGIAFASTLRPLLDAAVVPRVLDVAALPTYLSFGYLPGAETLVEGIHELLPGQHLTFRRGRVSEARTWSLPAEDAPPPDEADAIRDLRERLERAVVRRLTSGTPVAATLSGGIDSSLVVALAQRLHDAPVVAHSLSFGPRAPNELEFSSLVARHCGVSHAIHELSPRRVIERFDATLGALSKPIGEPLTVANSLLFEGARDTARVVLNGEGGDPCFGGPKNIPMVIAALYGAEAGELRARERDYLLAHRRCYGDLERILAPDVAAEARDRLERRLAPHLADPRWTTLVNRLTALNITYKGAHHILAKIDHLSRPHGVLPRSPLFDRAVVDAAVRLPASLKLNGATEKYALKRAVADLLPEAILARPKSGMRVPVEAWLRSPLDRFRRSRFERFACERLLEGLAPYGLVQRQYLVDLLMPRAGARTRGRGATIWLLLSLEAWLRTVLGTRN